MKIPRLSATAHITAAASLLSILAALPALATPYASGVQMAGTNVSFILNQPADQLSVSINGGAPVILDGTTTGLKNFSLGSPTDTFAIRVRDNDAVGYRIATGGTIAPVAAGLSVATNAAGFSLVSSDANALGRFNSPRGVTVSNNPNAPNFGTAYISNSAAGTVAANGVFPARTLTGEGLYALRADFTDAYSQSNAARTGTLPFDVASASSPFRITAASNGDIYVADFSDSVGMVGRMSPNMTTGGLVLANTGGASSLPVGRNHGSTTAVYPVFNGTSLTLYTLDEDLTTNYVTGAGPTTDKNGLWRYDIGSGSLPYSGLPTRVAGAVLVPLASSDLDIGADSKIYAAQNRSAGGEAGVQVISSDGSATLYNSLDASRLLLGNPTAADILRNVQGMAVSADQLWMAVVLNNSDVAVMPMVNGIPDLSLRMVVDTGTDINSGRDIAFDAAGNIHYVSSGQGAYRVLSAGGDSDFVTGWDGSQFYFTGIPEPGVSGLLLLTGGLLLRRRRRA